MAIIAARRNLITITSNNDSKAIASIWGSCCGTAWHTKRKMPVVSQDLTIEAPDNSAIADLISKQDK